MFSEVFMSSCQGVLGSSILALVFCHKGSLKMDLINLKTPIYQVNIRMKAEFKYIIIYNKNIPKFEELRTCSDYVPVNLHFTLCFQ